MKKMMIVIAATIALPAAAFAQAAPAPSAAPAAPAGHDMTAMSCKDMHAMMSGSPSGHPMPAGSGQTDRSKMDHSKMDHSKMASCSGMAKAEATQAPAGSHANRKQ